MKRIEIVNYTRGFDRGYDGLCLGRGMEAYGGGVDRVWEYWRQRRMLSRGYRVMILMMRSTSTEIGDNRVHSCIRLCIKVFDSALM